MIQTVSSMKSSGYNVTSTSDVYFSADVETDGPIPGPFSLLSFALVVAGTFDGQRFERANGEEAQAFYRELMPISQEYEPEALMVNGLDRQRLQLDGISPAHAMSEAANWVRLMAQGGRPVLVAYPLSFDWSWLYWYFVRFSDIGSPFSHSHCFDLKTAFAVKSHRRIGESSRAKLPFHLQSHWVHSHNALDDAREQAEIFANVFEWSGANGRDS